MNTVATSDSQQHIQRRTQGSVYSENSPLIGHVEQQTQHHGGQNRHVDQDVAAAALILRGELGRSRCGAGPGSVRHLLNAWRTGRIAGPLGSIQTGPRYNVQPLVYRVGGREERKKEKNKSTEKIS